MQWKNAVYVDGMLLFGLRSAPKIFNALADGLEWCVKEEGVQHVFQYLDDFIVLGAAESPECSDSLCTLKHTCRELGRGEAGRTYVCHKLSRYYHQHQQGGITSSDR